MLKIPRQFQYCGPMDDGYQSMIAPVLDMFVFMPSMALYLKTYKVIPPLAVLNDLMMSGSDPGMGSACRWQGFEFSGAMYQELLEVLEASPEHDCVVDTDLLSIDNVADWNRAVHAKYGKSSR